MTQQEHESKETEGQRSGDEQLISLITQLLTGANLPENLPLPHGLEGSEAFERLRTLILDIRLLSSALSKGELHKFVYSKGFIISNLKALQSNLRHLTWQTQKLAEGDFSQRVDFLGEFSQSFNIMAQKLQVSSNQLRQLAGTDTLTQLANRLALDSFLEESFEGARHLGQSLSVLMLDIDHFKRVNDTYGHGVGDQVLVDVSRILGSELRTTDMFARYGGEEFMAVLPGCSLDKAAEIGARAIRAVAEARIDISCETLLRVTVSGGVSEMRPSDTSYTDIISRSDEALYRAKNTGRNRVCTE